MVVPRLAPETFRYTELWELLGAGDGNKCPIWANCEVRQAGGWCLSEQLFDFIGTSHEDSFFASNGDDVELGQFQHLFKQSFPFSTPWQSGLIMELTERLAQSCLEEAHITRVPVGQNVVQWLRIQPSIEIRHVPFRVHHGAVWRLEDAWVMQINSHDSAVRRRWTVFHELFHVLAMAANPKIIFKRHGSDSGQFNEFVADYFATCMLMPTRFVFEQWEEAQHRLSRLAKAFQVPEVAAWVRVKTLGLL